MVTIEYSNTPEEIGVKFYFLSGLEVDERKISYSRQDHLESNIGEFHDPLRIFLDVCMNQLCKVDLLRIERSCVTAECFSSIQNFVFKGFANGILWDSSTILDMQNEDIVMHMSNLITIPEGMEVIILGMKLNFNLTPLWINWEFSNFSPSLEFLMLDCFFSTAEFEQLTDILLTHFHNMKNLVLVGTKHSYFARVAHKLLDLKRLTCLELVSCGIGKFKYDWINHIGAGVIFFNAVKNNHRLKYLNISLNKLGRGGTIALCNAIKNHASIEGIRATSCNLGIELCVRIKGMLMDGVWPTHLECFELDFDSVKSTERIERGLKVVSEGLAYCFMVNGRVIRLQSPHTIRLNISKSLLQKEEGGDLTLEQVSKVMKRNLFRKILLFFKHFYSRSKSQTDQPTSALEGGAVDEASNPAPIYFKGVVPIEVFEMIALILGINHHQLDYIKKRGMSDNW